MKKTYMTPQMEAVEIKLQGMIAMSGELGSGSAGGGAKAPQMPNFTDFDDFQNQFDFTGGLKLW